MSDIKWQAPPQDKRGGGKSRRDYPALRDALRARPNEWALIHHGGAGILGNLKLQLGPGFEFTTRKCDDGKSDIYVRAVSA